MFVSGCQGPSHISFAQRECPACGRDDQAVWTAAGRAQARVAGWAYEVQGAWRWLSHSSPHIPPAHHCAVSCGTLQSLSGRAFLRILPAFVFSPMPNLQHDVHAGVLKHKAIPRPLQVYDFIHGTKLCMTHSISGRLPQCVVFLISPTECHFTLRELSSSS